MGVDGVKSCRPGPHGPVECAELSEFPGQCACGCDAVYASCFEQQRWYEQQQREADKQSGRQSRWEDLP